MHYRRITAAALFYGNDLRSIETLFKAVCISNKGQSSNKNNPFFLMGERQHYRARSSRRLHQTLRISLGLPY